MSKNQFVSRIGLIAATVGSAVGLGNIWRFPAEAQTNGGAAFLLLYIICVFVLGVPVMLSEFAIGRAGRNDAVGSFRALSPGTAWWTVGAVGLLASYLIGIFYMVVAGWTLEYLFESVTGGLFEGIGNLAAGADFSQADTVFAARMDEYVATPWRPMLFTALIILVNIGVLLKGVSKGIERLSNIMMPLLFVVLVALCCVTLTLPGASEGVEWFLRPDFSVITPRTVINALGQTFFSLSLGMGILITYASYYPDNTRLGGTSVTVALTSLLVAVLVGFVIFPAVSSFGLTDHSLRGTTLVFQTLPEVFACLPGTRIWSSLFFILLLVAALTSTGCIMEVGVGFRATRCRLGRRAAG
ncbi:MAG: sodium-dependent transporter, partial [Muribaculaceae bacterium]|nr:sodium-dependent transporter [Muribaculaceae bacterium]